jgi:hypothetical protein
MQLALLGMALGALLAPKFTVWALVPVMVCAVAVSGSACLLPRIVGPQATDLALFSIYLQFGYLGGRVVRDWLIFALCQSKPMQLARDEGLMKELSPLSGERSSLRFLPTLLRP